MDSTNLRTFFLFSLAFLHLQSTSCSTPTKKGFTLELIYRDSIKSPLYPGNLTESQMIQRRVQFAKARGLSTKSSIISSSDRYIRPILNHEGYSYLVKLKIGDPGTEQFLFVDTGSDIIWTQIEPCNPCFPQTGPKYNPSKSYTVLPVMKDHHLCEDYDENSRCIFTVSYVDGASTKGFLVSDAFNITDDDETFLPRIVFGCASSSNEHMAFTSTKFSGILGMGRGQSSFVMQLSSWVDTSHFAYCMVDAFSTKSSHIRFGSDIKPLVGGQSTPLLMESDYYVSLLDIALNGTRLNLPPSTFSLYPNGTGGCILDTGATTSCLIKPAYSAVRRWLEDYFSGHHMIPAYGKDLGYDLCYLWQKDYTGYPSMDFHFVGAVLNVLPRDLFAHHQRRKIFCLDLLEQKTVTLIGAAHQQNYQFAYDLEKNMLHFGRDNCLDF